MLYTANVCRGKIFAVFQPIAKVFPLNYLLCKVHDGIGPMRCESFHVNGMLCTMTVFPSKHLLYMVYRAYMENFERWKFGEFSLIKQMAVKFGKSTGRSFHCTEGLHLSQPIHLYTKLYSNTLIAHFKFFPHVVM